MAISFTPLGSGSKGNSVLVESDGGKFLIDCGFCVSTLRERLAAVHVSLEEIEGVVITHEHSDHIKGAAVLSDKFGIPVIGQQRTLRYMRSRLAAACGLDEKAVLKSALAFNNLEPFELCGLAVIPFRTPHDAVFPVGYRFEDSESRAVYATDIGYVSREVKDMLKGAELIMFESNYDRDMLIRGKYPPRLKERIMSSRGHLSNDDCALAVTEMMDNGTQNIILGHISQENNLPSLVDEVTETALYKRGARKEVDYKLTIALQDETGERRYAESI